MSGRHPLLTGIALVALAFLLGPILPVIGIALTAGDTIEFPPRGLSPRWFAEAVAHEPFLAALRTSVLLAAAGTALALLLGLPVALALTRSGARLRAGVGTLFTLPVIVPELVLGYALFQTLMVDLRVDAFGALLAGHTVLLLPYAVRVTGAALARADPSLEEAARGLGATGWTTFTRVTLPVARPGIVAAAVLSVVTSFNNVPLSLLLNGPGTTTLPVEMLHHVEFAFDPLVAAACTLLLALAVAVTLVTERLAGFTHVFGRQEATRWNR
ncbi:ABC transporter permease [Nonomuraea longicatena]|uniref:ABC transporter permease n=1 Tax=Nonomuraea longicatena TaxID=83682 RepID=A0ABP4AKN6_9ACTN